MIEPTTPSTLPEMAYVLVRSAKPGERIGLVKSADFVSGAGSDYYATDLDEPGDILVAAEAKVIAMNARLGVDSKQARAMQAGSMFGIESARSFLNLPK